MVYGKNESVNKKLIQNLILHIEMTKFKKPFFRFYFKNLTDGCSLNLNHVP